MSNLVAGTQVYYRSSIPGIYDIQGGSSSFVIHLFWIWTIQTKGTTSVRRRWNIPAYKSGDSAGEWIYVSVDLIFLISSTLVQIQSPSPTLFSQICHLTRWILVWNFQICLELNYSNLLCSLLFSIYQFLPWFGLFSKLICRSPLCFGFIQGTVLM